MKNVLLTILALLLCAPAAAAGLFSQLVLNLGTERPFHFVHQKNENSLLLEIEKTHPNELKALEHYDERLVKRVLIKDLGPAGTEVRIVLRDRRVRASVYELHEPFRIAVDLFDVDYKEEKDPTTGLPLAETKDAKRASPGGDGSSHAKLLVAPPDAPAPSPSSEPASPSGGKKLLVSPVPDLTDDPQALTSVMKDAPDGIGKAWRDFPPYIYRLQTAAYEEGLSGDKEIPPPTAAVSSAAAMADYAGKLYNLGHEAKALIAYQQVLHREPTLFDKDALHLWKFAEAHLGQGNLTLARGYYQAILEKHPESPIARFAQLRILDVAAIRLTAQGKPSELPELLPRLSKLKLRTNGELAALIAIRETYWAQSALELPQGDLPKVDGVPRQGLAASYPHTESSRTAFFAASLLLNDMLRTDTPWDRSYGKFAEGYFKRFSGSAAEPHRSRLKDQLHAKLSATLQGKAAEGKLIEAIDDYEALPASLKSITKEPKNAWALAESYRKLGQPAKAADLYALAGKGLDEGKGRFKAFFWLAVTAGEHAEGLKASKAGGSEVGRYQALSRQGDRDADAAWSRLKGEEQRELEVAFKEPFEKTISGVPRLRAPAKIVLSSWTRALATRTTATAGTEPSDWQKSFSPSGSAVLLLTDLARRFAEMGMTKERRAAVTLLKHMKPAEFDGDKAAKDVWASELLKLAEDYRKANEYLEAGRLYSLVGKEAENFEGRAEALYKGGLLLFRSGRREEALAAFKDAAADGNNLFYSNLAKERLSQLEP